MPATSWTRAAGYRALEPWRDWGTRNALLQAAIEDPASFFATYPAGENDRNAVELHGQVAVEDGAIMPVAPERTPGEAARERRPADGVTEPANKKAKVSTKARNDQDNLAKRTCESCGTVFKN